MKRFFVIFTALMAVEKELFAAEAGMPQLDPKYWASQTFWLIVVFLALYIAVSKYFLPIIKKNLDDRENKIKDDLEEARNLKEISEKKQFEYLKIIENAKKQVSKVILESKNKLDNEINAKKIIIEKDIEKEIEKAQKEILNLKKDSIESINQISEEVTLKLIENISGDRLNESSIKAAVSEVSKTYINRYL